MEETPEAPRPVRSSWRAVLGAKLGRRARQELGRRVRARTSAYFSASARRERVGGMLRSLLRHHAVRTANAMAFDLFLALVPMLGLAGWLLSQFVSTSPEALARGGVLLDLTPAELHGMLTEQLTALSATSLAPLAVLVGWWLSSSAFYTALCVFEESFECQPRSWLEGRLVSLLLALLGLTLVVVVGFVVLTLTLESLGMLGRLASSVVSEPALRFALGLAGLGLVWAFLALLYRVAIRRPGKRRRVWLGAGVATLLGALSSVALGYYATNIARYSLFYGGLAAVVILLVWLWLWCSAVLLGAELSVMLEDVERP
jgi:membrane protein